MGKPIWNGLNLIKVYANAMTIEFQFTSLKSPFEIYVVFLHLTSLKKLYMIFMFFHVQNVVLH